MRKAQVTIFIIVGIILLIVIGFLFYALSKTEKVEIKPIDVSKEVEIYVDGCLKSTTEDGVRALALRGGYYGLPDLHFSSGNIETAYGVYENKYGMITKEGLERSLSDYIRDNIDVCLDNFSAFPGKDFEIGRKKTSVKINPNNVLVDMDFDLRVNDKQFSRFSAIVNRPYGELHMISQDIVKHHLEDPDWIDMTLLSSYSAKVNLAPVDNTTFLVTVEKGNIIFIFAEKLLLNIPPTMDIDDKFAFSMGDIWHYKIKCTDPEGDEVKISDDSAMIDMLDDGTILSTLTLPGDYDVTFECVDDMYNKATKTVLIKVLEKVDVKMNSSSIASNSSNGGNNTA